MSSNRFALIIANDQYENESLSKLEAPKFDAYTLAEFLGDPDSCDFYVQLAVNKNSYTVNQLIEAFYNKRKRIVISILLLLILLISSTPIPFTLGDDTETVQIGVIFPNENWMNFMEPVVSLAKDDINQFMAENDYKYRIEFIYKNAEQNQELHLEKLTELKEEDIDLVIGCIWTRFALLSVEYANENQMIIISPSATGDTTAWGVSDNYFRLAPTDYIRFQILGEFMWSQGEKACIIIGPNDILTKEDTQLIEEILQFLGIESRIETYEETYEGRPDFEIFVNQMDEAISDLSTDYSLDQIAIFDHPTMWGRIAPIANALLENEVNQEITWYTSGELHQNTEFIQELEPESSVLKFYYPQVYLQDSVQYRYVNERYSSIVGSDLGLYNATLYDTCWLYANSIIEADSQSYDRILEQIPYVASTYEGITGTLLLDANGDRISPDYSIMGLADASEVTFEKYGYYNARTSEIIWTSLSPRNELIVNFDIIVENNGPYRGKIDEDIFFSAEGTYLLTGDLHSYRWSFGDGSFSFGKNPSHSYYLPGTYPVKLRVVDSEGIYQESETECTITKENKLPIARAQITEPYYCYVNDSLEFSSFESYDEDGEIISVMWDFGDGEISTDQLITHSFTNRDLFEVTLTVTDDEGASQEDTVKCYVMDRPIVQIEGPYTRKKGELITFYTSVIFDDFDEENKVEEYEWSLEGSFSKAYEESPSHIFNSEGTFPVSVEITDSRGNKYKDTAELTINPVGVKIFGSEISMDTLRDYSGWILGAIVAIITIFGAGSGAIRNIIIHFNQNSEKERFYEVMKKRLRDLEKTYENNPETLTTELLELKEEILTCLRDKSITMDHYTQLDEEIDKVLDNTME